MKKKFLSLTAMIAVAMTSFGQNSSIITQTGNAQIGNVQQFGNLLIGNIQQTQGSATNSNSEAFILQGTTTNPINVKQTATISQLNGSNYNHAQITQAQAGALANEASIEQNGSGANRSGGTSLFSVTPGLIPATGLGTAPPASTGNYATISQTGLSRTSTYIQQNAGSAGGSSSNYAEMVQSNFSDNAGGTGVRINQNNNANQNRASLSVTGGAQNYNYLYQTDDSQRNLAVVKETGSGNLYGDVYQQFNSHDNEARVNQAVINGFASINQISTSYNNKAQIDQNNNTDSEGTITQQNNSHDNKAQLTQNGDANIGFIYQENQIFNAEATLTQESASNTSTIRQRYSGGTFTRATVTQQGGTGNDAQVQQGFTNASVVSENNEVTVNQNGTNNRSSLYQYSLSNTANVEQLGTGNTVYGINASGVGVVGSFATQIGTGVGNDLIVNQNNTVLPGFSQQAFVGQTGSGNLTTINQTGN